MKNERAMTTITRYRQTEAGRILVRGMYRRAKNNWEKESGCFTKSEKEETDIDCRVAILLLASQFIPGRRRY